MSALVDFRTLQAIGDLQALAGSILDDAVAGWPRSEAQRVGLRRLVTAEGCSIDSDASLALWPVLDKTAVRPARPDAVCALSNGVLMANALQGGDRHEAAGGLWSNSVARLRRLPHRLRGPLALAAGRSLDRSWPGPASLASRPCGCGIAPGKLGRPGNRRRDVLELLRR